MNKIQVSPLKLGTRGTPEEIKQVILELRKEGYTINQIQNRLFDITEHWFAPGTIHDVVVKKQKVATAKPKGKCPLLEKCGNVSGINCLTRSYKECVFYKVSLREQKYRKAISENRSE